MLLEVEHRQLRAADRNLPFDIGHSVKKRALGVVSRRTRARPVAQYPADVVRRKRRVRLDQCAQLPDKAVQQSPGSALIDHVEIHRDPAA